MPPRPIQSAPAAERRLAQMDNNTQTDEPDGPAVAAAALPGWRRLPGAAAAGGDPPGPDPEPPADPDTSGAQPSLLARIPVLGSLVSHQRSTDKSTQTHRDPVQSEAEKLALDIVYYAVGKRRQEPDDKVCRTLRRCVDDILSKHRILLTGMVNRLQIREETGYQTFVGVVDELFEGGNITWARIVTFYAFGARLAIYCQEKDMEDFIGEIARYMGLYAAEHLTPFVKQEGGWNVLCENFRYPESLENTVWKTLLKLGVGLGIAATASLITSSQH